MSKPDRAIYPHLTFDQSNLKMSFQFANSSLTVYPYCPYVMTDTLQLARLTNQKIYVHPITLAVYFATLAALITYSGVLPARDWGRTILFTAALTSGFLVAGEMVTRNRFEALATDMLQKDDSLLDIQKFFDKDKFLVATLGGELIGVVGLQVEGRVGTVRHWGVMAKYRSKGLGWDLLERVIANSKGTKKGGLKSIKCETYNLQARAEKSLKNHGFQRTGNEIREAAPIGWFGVKRRVWIKEL
jgi:N-acetylglutamate synthase-like GNAT family acetyltransferase